MKKLSKKKIEKRIKKLVPYWAKKLRMPTEIALKRDNRKFYPASVNIKYGKYRLTYNSKVMASDGYNTHQRIIYLIFHELGHLKKKALHKYIGKIKAEYIAEITALKWLKKYFRGYYKTHVNYMRGVVQNKHYFANAFHNRAFRLVKEYRYIKVQK
jgi:hypothetical protein